MHMHVTVPDRELWKMSEVARQIRKIHPSARIWFQNLDHGVGVVHGFAHPSKGYDAIVSWIFGPEYLRPYFRSVRNDWDILAEECAKPRPARKSDRIESEVDQLVDIIEKKAGIPQEIDFTQD